MIIPNAANLEWTDELVSRFWAYYAQTPDVYFTHKFGGQIISRLRRHLAGKQSILDYGCGTGALLNHLLLLGYRVTGTDYSKESVDVVARRYGGKANFSGAFTLDELDEHHEQFDAILVVEVFEHLNDHYLEDTINNVRRLLTPNGILIITTPNEEDLSSNTVYCPQCNCTFHSMQHVRTWNTQTLPQYMRRSGFRIVETFTTDFTLSVRRKPLWFFLNVLAYGFKRKKRPHLVCIAGNSAP